MNFQEVVDDLQSLDANNVGGWPLYVFVGACVLAFFAVIGGGYYQFVIPKLDQLDRVKAQESGLRAEFEKKQKKVANLDAYRAQLEEMERSFGSMLRQLPSKTEVANLLNDISQTRVASGLEEQLFQPQSEVRKEFYAEIPNKIVVVGSYHEIALFVSRVSALPRIVTINDVQISPSKRPSTPGRRSSQRSVSSAEHLQLQAIAKTYRYLEEEGGQ